MKTRAAVLRQAGTPWEITELELGASRAKKYTLDEINDGYQDLMDGKNIRGGVVHQQAVNSRGATPGRVLQSCRCPTV